MKRLTQQEFEQRLARLLRAARDEHLCGGRVTLALMCAAGAVAAKTDPAVLKAYGIGCAVLPVTDETIPDDTNTRH